MGVIADLPTPGLARRSSAFAVHSVADRPTIVALVAEVARRMPGRTALRDRSGSRSYAALSARAASVTAALRAHGVTPNKPVGVVAGRCLDTPALLLGVLGAGCFYVPISPDSPPALQASILDAVAPAALLVVDDLRESVPEEWQHAVCPTGTDSLADAAWPGDAAHPDGLAYAMATSGTTGTPKIVAIAHRNVTRLMVAPDYAQISTNSVGLALSPLSFDAAVFDFWPFLANGATVVLHPDETPTPDSIAAHVRDFGVTTLFVTTGLFRRIAEDQPSALAGVNVLTGGERGRAADARAVLAAGARSVVHCYGPTETAVFATAARYTDAVSVPEDFPVGRPIAGTDAHVLGPDGPPVAIGEPGELWIGGEAVGAGYLDAAETDRFSPDRFRGTGRLYRTGDQVRMQADGQIVYLDRLDDQVKIRGHRVDPNWVARTIEQLQAVRQAIVVAEADSGGGQRLLAFVTARDAANDLPRLVRDHVAALLPPALCPSETVVVERIPLLPNGKTDRNALLALRRRAPGAYAAWSSTSEHLVAQLFTELLGFAPEGPDDDFFDLGGDSLLAIRLVGRLKTQGEAGISLRELHRDATVAGVAAWIDQMTLRPEEGLL